MAADEFKVILVGESGVGKTSFLIRFADSKFQNTHESTVGVDCKKVSFSVGETPIDLHIWDTAGQERFKSIVNRFFRSADGVIVMYDVTKQSTFDEVPWWLKETREYLTGVPIFLVGNKNDDGNKAEVLEELAQDFAEENRLYLFLTSAKDNVNVSEVFTRLASMMLEDRRRAPEPDERTKLQDSNGDSELDVRKILLNPQSQPPTKTGCCAQLESPVKAHVV